MKTIINSVLLLTLILSIGSSARADETIMQGNLLTSKSWSVEVGKDSTYFPQDVDTIKKDFVNSYVMPVVNVLKKRSDIVVTDISDFRCYNPANEYFLTCRAKVVYKKFSDTININFQDIFPDSSSADTSRAR